MCGVDFYVHFDKYLKQALSLFSPDSCHGNQTEDFLLTLDFLRLWKVF